MNQDLGLQVSWSLGTLPAEIFGFVAFYLDLAELARCMQAGNKRLTRILLSPGAITSLNYEAGAIPLQTLNFFLRTLPTLSHLRFSALLRIFSTADWLKLPSTLIELKISQRVLSLDPTTFSLCDAFPKLRAFQVSMQMCPSVAAMLPPTLEILIIGNLQSCSLPASLTMLKLTEQQTILELLSPMPNLAEVLVSLRVGPLDDCAPFLASLPQTLTSLTVDNGPQPINTFLMGLLPQALTHLQWTPGEMEYEPVISNDLITFPPRLTDMYIAADPDEDHFAPFPQSLKRLSVCSPEDCFPIFPLLPSGLESFTYDGNDMLMMDIMPLPATLTEFRVPSGIFDFVALSSIPRSVTALELLQIIVSGKRYTEKLIWPIQALEFPNLTHFSLNGPQYLHEHAALFRCLVIGCPNLIQCHLTYNTSYSSEHPQPEHSISADAHSAFCQSFYGSDVSSGPASSSKEGISRPKGKTGSTISSPTLAAEPPYRFGQGLTTFIAAHSPFGDEFLATLPHSALTMLHLPQSPFITDASFAHTIQHCHVLETLYCASSAITGRAFVYLPRKLQTISFPMAQSITDDDIHHIPPTVTKLHLRSAIHLTDGCSYALPKNLRDLGLYENRKVSSAMISFLPKTGVSRLDTKNFSASVSEGIITYLIRY